MQAKDFYLNESQGFRLHVKSRPCMRPTHLNCVEFTQETLSEGEVTQTSTYTFFLYDNDIKILCQQLGDVI